MYFRIDTNFPEIRFKVCHEIQVYTSIYNKDMIIIEDTADDREILVWTEDVDNLIQALQALKRAIENLDPEATPINRGE